MVSFLAVGPAGAGDEAGGLRRETLRVGFTKNAFLHVNRNDVEAGYRVLAETVGRRRGYQVECSTKLFEDTEVLEQALEDGSLQMVVVDAWRYLGMNSRRLDPAFLSSEQGQVGRTYALLTRADSGLKTLADLRDKEVQLFEVANASLGGIWLTALLLGVGVDAPDTFFHRVESVGKPTAAVLPVFFGKKQACVVDAPSLAVIQELNPQVGKALRAIETSEPLSSALICLYNGSWRSDTFRQDLIQTVSELHLDPAGQQLLTLFRTDRLVRFEERRLDSIRRLRARVGDAGKGSPAGHVGARVTSNHVNGL
jgi:phosphonate transport system substrate-binding protein